MSELKAGAHVKGTTIAELGNRNRPLDMIVYHKDGKDYLLMTNSSRGVMKIPTENAGTAEGINAPVNGKKGIGYDTIDSLKGVQSRWTNSTTIMLCCSCKKIPMARWSLRTIELP